MINPLTDTYHVDIRLTEEEAEEISKMLSLKMEEVRYLKERYGDEHIKIRMKYFLSGMSQFNFQLAKSKLNNAEHEIRKANINAR